MEHNTSTRKPWQSDVYMEMLEALKAIAEYPLNVEGYNSLQAVRLRYVAMQGIARKAIARAEGGA